MTIMGFFFNMTTMQFSVCKTKMYNDNNYKLFTTKFSLLKFCTYLIYNGNAYIRSYIVYKNLLYVLFSCAVYHLEVNHFLLLRVEQMKYVKYWTIYKYSNWYNNVICVDLTMIVCFLNGELNMLIYRYLYAMFIL